MRGGEGKNLRDMPLMPLGERGGEVWGGGFAPSPLYSPLQPIRTQPGYYVTGWRGVRGEATFNQPKLIMGFRLHNLPDYAIINVEMRELVKISGFILIAIGTVGLLLNGFFLGASSSCTIIFAVANFVGLVNLAFAHFGMKKSKTV